jgi:hypothetical protein
MKRRQFPTAEHKPDEHDGFVFVSADSKGAWWMFTTGSR